LRKLAILLGTVGPLMGQSWYNSGWTFRKTVAVDHRRVFGNLTNFPVFLQFDADPDMAGRMQSSCQDLLITLANGTKLDHQLLTCDALKGSARAYVRVPSVTASADTVLLVYYGNRAAPDQQNARGVWDANYKVVLPGGSLTDATANGNNTTTHGTVAAAASPFGTARYFNGTNAYLTTATAQVTSYTVEACYKYDTNGNQTVVGTNNRAFGVGASSGQYHGSAALAWPTVINPTPARWYCAAQTWDGSTVNAYLDGGVKQSAAAATLNSFTGGLRIGGDGSTFFRGWVADVRLSNVARPRAWLATQESNRQHPESFFRVGRLETNAAAAPAIDSFTANYGSVESGKPTVLAWLVRGAASVTIDQGVGPQTALISGAATVNPASTTTYTLTATNAQGTSTASVTVTALPASPPVVYVRAGGPAGVWLHGYKTDANGHALMSTAEPHNLVPGDYVTQWGITTKNEGGRHYASNLNGHFIVKEVVDTSHYTIADMSGAYVNPNDPESADPITVAGAEWTGRATPFPLASGPRTMLGGPGDDIGRRIAVEPARLVVSGGVATADLGYAHTVIAGNTISVWNTTASGNLNGEHVVTGVESTTITFATNSPNGTYTHNDTCGRNPANPTLIGGTDNCVRISQYAIASNQQWTAGVLSITNGWNASPANYKTVFDGGAISGFSGYGMDHALGAYRYMVDRKCQLCVDALVYYVNNIERTGGVNWAVMASVYSDFGGDQDLGHYGFWYYQQFSLAYGAVREHLTAAQRTAFAKKILNNIDDPANPCTEVFPDYIDVSTGTARGGSGNTIVLKADDTAADNYYVDNYVTFTESPTKTWWGRISGYAASTKTATVSWIGYREAPGSGLDPAETATWTMPTGFPYRIIATARVSGTTLTALNANFTSTIERGDAVLVHTTWGNYQIPNYQYYVSGVTDASHLTVIKAGAAPDVASLTPIWRIPQYKLASNHCGFIWRNMFTQGWPGNRSNMFRGWGTTSALEDTWHRMPAPNQNVGGIQASFDVAVGSALAEDDPRAAALLELGQSEGWDYQYRFNLMYRSGFTANAVWYGYGNDTVGMGYYMQAVHSAVPALPMPGIAGEFLTNIQRVKLYLPLPDHPTAMMLYGANSAASSLGFGNSYGPSDNWWRDFGTLFNPSTITAKYLNQFLTDVNPPLQASNSAVQHFPLIDPRTTQAGMRANYKAQPTQYFFNTKGSKAECENGTGKGFSWDFYTCDWATADAVISKGSWTDSSATQVMFQGRAFSGGYDTSEGGDIKIYKVGHLVNTDSYPPGSAQPNVARSSGTMIDFGSSAVLREYYNLGTSVSRITRWAGATNYGDTSGRYVYAMSDMQGAYDPTYNRVQRHFVHFKKAGTQEVVLQADDIDASNIPPAGGIRLNIHYTQNGNTGTPNEDINLRYDEGTTTCLLTANCDHSHTGVTMTAGDTIVSHQNGAAADSNGPARAWGVLTKVFSPGPVTLRWDGNSYTGVVWKYADRLSVCAGASCGAAATGLESVTVHKVTSNTDTMLDAKTLTTAAGWFAVQAEGKVALFARGGVLNTVASFTSDHQGTGQYLLAGMAAGNYNVTVNGSPVAGAPFTVTDGDNTIYFESTAGSVTVAPLAQMACTITTTTLAEGTVGALYSQRPATAYCSQPVTWRLSAGTMCAGLNLYGDSGTISGTPEAPQSCEFTVEATDGLLNTATQGFTIAVRPPAGTTVSAEAAKAGGRWR
jgi:hypothetical protein